jgi:hypothetical protein
MTNEESKNHFKRGVDTPWGQAQHVTEIAPGIVSVSTASHGGIHLSDERIAEMPKALQDFVPFGGKQNGLGRWFEEDCDWSVVALAFPQFFTDSDVKAAHATLKGYRQEVYEQFITERGHVEGAKPDRICFEPGNIRAIACADVKVNPTEMRNPPGWADGRFSCRLAGGVRRGCDNHRRTRSHETISFRSGVGPCRSASLAPAP